MITVPIDDQRPPVIVLGTGVTALGVLRILGRDGLNPIVAESSDRLLRRSRWFRSFDAPTPALDGANLANWLSQIPLERAVIIPCSDHRAGEVASLPEAIRARFPSSTPDARTLARFTDKADFADLLVETGIPGPFSKRLNCARDLDDVPESAFANAMLKPRDSQSFVARFRTKAVHVTSRRQAAERLAGIQAAGFEMILQEYIPGPATEHFFVDGFVDRTGAVRATFVRRRLRMFPTDFGNSTAMVSVPMTEAAPAIHAIESLLAAASYRGIFSAEFKRDRRDGRFKILEVNTRAWWYVDFAARCGVDVCGMAYDDALGKRVATVAEYRVGQRLVYPYHDFFAYRAMHRDDRLSTWSWLRSSIGAMQPVFQLADPLPGLAAGAETLLGFGWHRLARLEPRSNAEPAADPRPTPTFVRRASETPPSAGRTHSA